MLSILDNPLISTIRSITTERNIHAWLVGGAVRDWLLGRSIHDWDIAVEREAIPLARALADRLQADVYVLDPDRDTARVIMADAVIDIARLRVASIEGDLEARDFTINALAIDLAEPDRLIDLFNGQRDLNDGLIRAISEEALTTDPIRLLRGVRLSASLLFGLDPITAGWIKSHSALIQSASAERVRDELLKTLIEPGTADNLILLDAFDLLHTVLPEVVAMHGVEQSLPHHWDVFEHTRRVVDSLELILTRVLGWPQADESALMLPVIPAFVWDGLIYTLSPYTDSLRAHLQIDANDLERSRLSLLKWAALLHDIGKPSARTVDPDGRSRFFTHEDVGAELAADRMRELRFNKDAIDRVSGIIRSHMRPHHLAKSAVTRRAIYRFFHACGDYGVDVLLLSIADRLATHGPDLERDYWVTRLGMIDQMLSAYFEQGAPIIAPPQLVTGDDVMSALNLKPGKHIGAILEAIREAQADGEVQTKEEALQVARRMLEEK
ncbi:MAG TPA: HD domain-containing protein [Anaerolineae bacterium]|nr:HD domain-containing protein [Anaerolineae bacterium]